MDERRPAPSDVSWQRLLLALANSAAVDAGNVVEAAQLVCDAACQGLQAERCSLWLRDDSGASLRAICVVDGGDPGFVAPVLLPALMPRYFAALGEQRSLAIDDCANDLRCAELFEDYLRPLGVGALLDTPIHRRGGTVGILCVEHRGGARAWHRDELAFAGNLADLVARALTSAERLNYQRELETLNATLERRVDERTRSLQEALGRLESTRAQLIESEKLAALGSLVASIAHEVNSPIGVALTATTHGSETLGRLQQGLGGGSLTRSALAGGFGELEEALSLATRNIERAAKLIANFKQTAADRTSQKRASFELGAYVDAVVATLMPLLRKRGVMVKVEPEGYVTLDSYPGAVAHVLSNLVSNAVAHAFGPGTSDPRIRISVRAHDAGAELEVADNGCGMDAATRERAFEPFYTTARGRGGTGLGLSIVQSMVNQTLGGELELHSEPGAGTRFRIRLPRSAPNGADHDDPLEAARLDG